MSFLNRIHALISYIKNPNQLYTNEMRNLIVISSVGFAQGLINSSEIVLSYIYKDDYQLSPAQASMFSVSNKIPWMIKPLWGSLSDTFYLFGYKRKSYILVMAVLGWLCNLQFGLWVSSSFSSLHPAYFCQCITIL